MPLPVIANTFRVAFNWEEGVSNDVNVMHFRKTAGGGTASAVADAIIAAAAPDMWKSMSNGAHMTKLQVTPLDGASATVERDVPTSNADFQGQSASDYLPAVAVIVKLTTTTRGRSYRGRIFLPMTGEGVVVNGQISSGTQTAAQAAWATFLADMGTAGIPLVVASYKLSVATNVANVLVETDLATQRRRQSRLR